ncbi:MAG: DUF3783 domain-containing protein [Oscillospiraceae bacterium]|nr:DUF3783 domain-containing protein [Oscillospiraceae bacterium]
MKAVSEIAFLYNFNDPERLRKLKSALLCMKVRTKVVDREQFQQPIGVLAGLVDIAFVEPEDDSDFTEEMLVLYRFSSRRIDELLMRIKKAGVGNIPYKAAVTQTNLNWSGVQLYRELKKEHEAMAQGKMAHQAATEEAEKSE